MSDDTLSSLSATELIALYRSKQLSPVEVVTATVERIGRLNPIYNAFVVVDPDSALKDARASEARWQKGAPDGLIDGLPATVKDLVVVKGWPTRRGSRTTDATPSEEDGPPVARMRRQGAAFLGKTTTPEFGWRVSLTARSRA
jgi:aspartyl-tRNA(Asn)/glutamyl-tRNA(Gln) amidotransferase subunit A